MKRTLCYQPGWASLAKRTLCKCLHETGLREYCWSISGEWAQCGMASPQHSLLQLQYGGILGFFACVIGLAALVRKSHILFSSLLVQCTKSVCVCVCVCMYEVGGWWWNVLRQYGVVYKGFLVRKSGSCGKTGFKGW